MRRHESSKSNICTVDLGVNVAGIRVEVSVHYSGRSVVFVNEAATGIKRCLETRPQLKKYFNQLGLVNLQERVRFLEKTLFR